MREDVRWIVRWVVLRDLGDYVLSSLRKLESSKYFILHWTMHMSIMQKNTVHIT